MVEMDHDGFWMGAWGGYDTPDAARHSSRKFHELRNIISRLSGECSIQRSSQTAWHPTASGPWDIAVSYAREERPYVSAVVRELLSFKLNVFFDVFLKIEMADEALRSFLTDVYGRQSTFIVIFASEAYERKVLTNLEREIAYGRMFDLMEKFVIVGTFDKVCSKYFSAESPSLDLTQLTPIKCAREIVKVIRRVAADPPGQGPGRGLDR